MVYFRIRSNLFPQALHFFILYDGDSPMYVKVSLSSVLKASMAVLNPGREGLYV